MNLLKLKLLIIIITLIAVFPLLPRANALCVGTLPASCLTELSEEEANETLIYVMSKYEEVELKIIGEPVSIYGLRLTYGEAEEELNIHFKYIDNTQYDIIQNCVFVLYHRQNECELIKTVCNTFLPFTPRPIMKRKDLRICNDGTDVQLVEKEDFDGEEETTVMTTTDIEQVVRNVEDFKKKNSDDENEKETKHQSSEAEKK